MLGIMARKSPLGGVGTASRIVRSTIATLMAPVLALLLCANKTGVVDQEDLAPIKTIVLIGPEAPKYYYVTTAESRQMAGMMTAAAGGGVLPFLIASGMAETELERRLEGHLAAIDLEVEIATAIEARLEQLGYGVSYSRVPERKPDKLLKRYFGVRGSGDALFDMAIVNTGYEDVYSGGALCPLINIKARLVDKDSKDEIYEHAFEYSCRKEGTSFLTLFQVDEKYRFKTHTDVADNADLAREALLAGVPLIADQIAAALTKKK
jgi:hypothetical protein